MATFKRNDKVYAKLGDSQIAAIVLERSSSLEGQTDLVWLKIAVRNPYFVDRWIVTDYPEPVWSTVLTTRSSLLQVPALDLYRLACVPAA
jgi:hypothetical protein